MTDQTQTTTGEYLNLADLHTIKGWLHGLSTCPDMNDVAADGGVTVADVYQQEAREFAGRIGRIIDTTPQPLAIGLDRARVIAAIDGMTVDATVDGAYYDRVKLRDDAAIQIADAILALAAPAEGDADVASALLWFGSQHNLELSYGYEVDGEGDDGWQVHRVNGGRNDREWTRLSFGHDTPIKAIAACLPAAPTGETGA